MQKIERQKAYKACDPFTTINRVRNLLASCDLLTIEHHQSYDKPGVHCCRVMLGDSDIAGLGIGTNGKGLDVRYALASAYGEIMERLQNSILFPVRQLKFATKRFLESTPAMKDFRARLEREDLILDFHYGPDEVYLDTEELVDICSDVLARMFRIERTDEQKAYLQKTFNRESIACLPYYSVLQSKVRLLPIKLIWNTCGTNGMCAGNTPKEALIQGISEVFERFVIRTMYQKEITPPTVPVEYFQNTEILARLRHLEETTGITATVKDCSLGLGLPVIGLLLTDTKANKYTFHLGADPCPITALERCLTEIFQGTPKDVEERFYPLDAWNKAAAKSGGQVSDAFKRGAYYTATASGTSPWPDSLFAGNSTYSCTGFSHPVSVSDSDDLAYLVNLISELGHDLYIRDVSFLGFPAYQVYIPGMSETDFIYAATEFSDWMNIVKNHTTLLNLRQADTDSIANLAQAIAQTDGRALPVTFDPRRWFLSNVHPALQHTSEDFLLTLLYSRIENYESAAERMEQFLHSDAAQAGPLRYYRAVHTYLKGKNHGISEVQLKEDLNRTFGEAVAKQALNDFAVPDDVFEHLPWPSCFDCGNCTIESSCRYLAVLRRVKKIQKIQQANFPDQEAVADIF